MDGTHRLRATAWHSSRRWSHHMVRIQLSAYEWRLAEATGGHRGFTSLSRQSSLAIHDKTCNATHYVQGTEFLNPGQTGVLGADQPLYAIAKQLQWTFPESLGEYKLVVLLGALHIEDKVHQMTGKLLRDSGWTTVLSQAQVLTSGRAQSALNEHHIKRTCYARWVPVHVRDMVQLSETHPDIHAKFLKGNFVVQKSPHKFSLIGKDQSHEQSNKRLQSHGGAVGLYENPEALPLFMLAGPDCSRCVEEFEVVLDHTKVKHCSSRRSSQLTS